nr:MAG TPA: hypothetical protein [Caudoviricetes sp.]
MACIGKITSDLVMPCGAPGPGDLGRPVSAKLINASDISSFTVSPSGATITRVTGAKSYDITAVNNSLTVSVGLKSQDIIPGAYDVSITFKNFNTATAELSAGAPLGTANNMSSSALVIAVEHAGGKYRVYGLGAPLVCTELVGDSTASEYYTYTYGVEDWQVGTTIHSLSKADYDALSTPVEQ